MDPNTRKVVRVVVAVIAVLVAVALGVYALTTGLSTPKDVDHAIRAVAGGVVALAVAILAVLL